MKAGPLVKGLLLVLPLSFLESGCKTKSSRTTPEAVPAASSQAGAAANNSNQNCGVGLYLVADPLDELSALSAPSITINPINQGDFSYASFEASTPDKADVVYYRGCLTSAQGSEKVKCSEKDPDFFHSILWESTATEGKLKDTRFWFGANQKVAAADSTARQYTVQAFSCVWWDRAGDALKKSANKFSLKSFDLYCGASGKVQNLTIRRSGKIKTNYYAQYAQNRHDRFIENNFRFYRASIDYVRRSSSKDDMLNYSLGNISRMGPNNFLNYSGSMNFVADLVEQTNPSESSLSLTTDTEQPISTLCNKEDIPAPVAPPPPAVQDPLPPLPAAPPPAELPTQPAATQEPDLPANVDPTEKDKLACQERDIREKASLSGAEPGSYVWDDQRKVCSYVTAAGQETDVPDVGNDVMPICSDKVIGKSNTGAYLGGTALIGIGTIALAAGGTVLGRTVYYLRQGQKAPVVAMTPEEFKWGNITKASWNQLKIIGNTFWNKLPHKMTKRNPGTDLSIRRGPAIGWATLSTLGVAGIIGGASVISNAKNSKTDDTKKSNTELNLTSGDKNTQNAECIPPSPANQALLEAGANASNASLDMHTAEANFLNSF